MEIDYRLQQHGEVPGTYQTTGSAMKNYSVEFNNVSNIDMQVDLLRQKFEKYFKENNVHPDWSRYTVEIADPKSRKGTFAMNTNRGSTLELENTIKDLETQVMNRTGMNKQDARERLQYSVKLFNVFHARFTEVPQDLYQAFTLMCRQ